MYDPILSDIGAITYPCPHLRWNCEWKVSCVQIIWYICYPLFVFLEAIPKAFVTGSRELIWCQLCRRYPKSCHDAIFAVIGALCVIGFNHGLPCYVKNMARGTQVDKNRGRRPRFLSWLRPEGHVFNIAWQAMIKTYYSMSPIAI